MISPHALLSGIAPNFWLIEAKKPKVTSLKFSIVDIRQAIGYSVHPEINAALVVLCDGRKYAVFRQRR